MWLLRLLLAAVSGALVFCSYQPLGWWPAAIAGFALLLFAARGVRTLRFGALLGLIHGLALYLLLLPWIGVYVGKMPYIALAITESLYSVAVGMAAVLATTTKSGHQQQTRVKSSHNQQTRAKTTQGGSKRRQASKQRGTSVGTPSYRWVWAFAFMYVADEWLRSTWPFGGFAWGRISWGQIGGPLAWFARLGGPALVSFATILVAVGVYYLINRRLLAGALLTVLPLAAGGVLSYQAGQQHNDAASVDTVNVAAIQGNVPRMGLDFNAQRRAVLSNHVRQTEQLAQTSAGSVDLVVWPENASDVNPFRDHQATALIDQAVRDIAAPVLVGTITKDEVGDRNTLVVFDPITGAGERHNKKFLQPFGEYMPMRDFFRKFSPLVDQAGDFKPGTGNGVVHMRAATTGKNVAVGVSTCYEVAFDASARDAVLGGAQLLTTPTNNATFGFTDMTYQQLAMSRMRAIETDRAVVVAATSGVSAIVNERGQVLQKSGIFEPATLVERVHLHTTITPAVRLGSLPNAVLSIIGALLAAIMTGRFIRRRRP